MKILLVTYTYPPSKSVNGFRPHYFAKTLAQHGYDVHVLTRHFTGLEKFNQYNEVNLTPFSISREEGVCVFRTPFENTWFKYHKISWIKNSGLWRFIYLIQLAVGRTTQESYNKWFKPYLIKLLKEYVYDLILVESGPTNLVNLVHNISTQFKIPYAIDFRDAYFHEMHLKNQQTLPVRKKLKLFFEKYYMKQSIQNSLFCISISDSLHKILDVPEEKREIILNGYDENIWSTLPESDVTRDFKIVIGGKLYDRDFLEPFLHAIYLFLSKSPENVRVLFIAPGDISIHDIIQAKLPFSSVQIIKDRLSYEETLIELSSAQVLMYHGWKGYTGIPGTKIFDYLRSGKNILIVPRDLDIIDELLLETKRGVSLDDPDKAAEQLNNWYQEWKSGEASKSYVMDEAIIHRYSREYQNDLLVKMIPRRLEARLKT
ncbi:MAG: hypothetical protein ABI761_18485 [Saprospiraceae bacterium]